ERLGDQAGMAASYGQLGILAQDRGDYAEAEARYRQSLEINERLESQAGMATGYHQLGMLAQLQGDYAEAAAAYRQSLQSAARARGYGQSWEIDARLGHQAGMAMTYEALADLNAEAGNEEAEIALHLRALAIRLGIGAPEARRDLAGLRASRARMDGARFAAAL